MRILRWISPLKCQLTGGHYWVNTEPCIECGKESPFYWDTLEKFARQDTSDVVKMATSGVFAADPEARRAKYADEPIYWSLSDKQYRAERMGGNPLPDTPIEENE